MAVNDLFSIKFEKKQTVLIIADATFQGKSKLSDSSGDRVLVSSRCTEISLRLSSVALDEKHAPIVPCGHRQING